MKIVPRKWINLFTAQAATTAAPTTAAQGVAIPADKVGKVVVVRLRHTTTAGNDARTCTITLWGYCPGEVTAKGSASITEAVDIASTAGWDQLNESYSLASVSADGSLTIFVLESPTVYSRLYARITAISGTGTALGCAVAFTQD